jgi:hypothetical protein
MGVGQFSCDSCGKTFAWKPQLAGKRVKCKCGAAMTVPSTDPAADDAGLDDLAALAHGGETYDDAPPPPPPPMSGRGGRGGGAATARAPAVASSACPSCGMGVAPGAVICVNCGTNLKTGKKLSTAKVAAGAGGGGAAPAFDRPFGVKSVGDENKLTPKQKTIIASIIGAVLIGVVVTVVVVGGKARARERERLARLNAGPKPKLERLLIASEKSGGLTQAIKDGTLYEEMHKDDPPAPRIRWTKDGLNAMADAVARAGVTYEARGWLENDPQGAWYGMTHDESLKLVTMLLDKYKCRGVQVVFKKDGDKVADTMIVAFPDYEKSVGGGADGPYRQEFRKWAAEFLKKFGDELPPELDQYYQIFRFKKGGMFGADADAEDEEDMDEDDADAEDETPARPATRKPKKPKPGAAAKPGAATPAAGAAQGQPNQ